MELHITTLTDEKEHDRDDIMLHAAFQVLADYMEYEKPDQVVDWDAEPEYRHAWAEMKSLYQWWKVDRPARNEADTNLHPAWRLEDNAALARLIAIRDHLWT